MDSSYVTRLRSKVETLAWFAARPEMYREALRRVRTGYFTTDRSVAAARKEKEQGTAWCHSVAVELSEALATLRLNATRDSLASLHPAEWSAAIERAEATPGMGGPGHLDLLYHLCRALPAASVIETGVAAGWSSLAVLLALDATGSGRLVSIDMPYPKRGNEHLVGAVVPTRLGTRWKLVRRPDRDALPGELKQLGSIDLAHYDSDKSYEGRMFAYPLLFGTLRAGGLLVSDDVEDNYAFRDYAAKVGRTPLVVEKSSGNFAGILLK